MPFRKIDRITPAQIIILGFLFLITVGTALLMLPVSTSGPGGASSWTPCSPPPPPPV